MPEAPAWFLRELKAFDPLLRLRWSAKKEMWQIERRVQRSLHPGTIKSDVWHDDYICARDGYILVASLPHRAISRTVFEKLRRADLWANGGWKAVADAIEEAEASEEKDRMEKFSEKIREYSRDFYDYLKIRDGRTIFNAGWING